VTFLENVATPISTFHGGQIAAGTTCFLTELTAAYIGKDGKYVGGAAQNTTRRKYGTPVAGAGAAQFPWSQALVLSLRTVLSRGRGSNGRVYWPATGMSIQGATGLIGTAQIDPTADDAKVLLDALNSAAKAAMPGTGGLSVMSNVGTGISATVTSVRLGRKLDRQERREKRLSEAYVTRQLAGVFAEVDAYLDAPAGAYTRGDLDDHQ